MKLFYTSKKRDAELMHKAAQAGYHMEHPEKVGGFAGAFLFTAPDFYVTDRIYNWVSENVDLRQDIQMMIRKFAAEDYGVVSQGEHMENAEMRYVAFGDCGMVGRYPINCGALVLETFGYQGEDEFKTVGLIYEYGEDFDRLAFLGKCFSELEIDINSVSQYQLQPRPWP